MRFNKYIMEDATHVLRFNWSNIEIAVIHKDYEFLNSDPFINYEPQSLKGKYLAFGEKFCDSCSHCTTCSHHTPYDCMNYEE